MALTEMRPAQGSRRSRVAVEQDDEIRDDKPAVVFEEEEPVEVGGDDQPDAKDAVAEAQRIADQRGRDAEDANRRAADADQRFANERLARVADRKALLSTTKRNSETAKASAKAALKAAREAGDVDAEITATEAFNAADADLRGAANGLAEIERIEKTQPPPQQRTEQRRDGPTPEAKQWMDSHPRFEKDDDYQADVIAATQLALKKGHAEGSRGYVDFVEQRMTDLYGKGHGDLSRVGKGRAQAARQSRVNSTSTSLPPDRGGGDGYRSGGGVGRNGEVSINHEQGSLTLSYDADGRPRLKGTIPSDWREAQKWQRRNFPDRPGEPGSGVVDYAVEQMRIEGDRRAGRSTGLTEEDKQYR